MTESPKASGEGVGVPATLTIEVLRNMISEVRPRLPSRAEQVPQQVLARRGAFLTLLRAALTPLRAAFAPVRAPQGVEHAFQYFPPFFRPGVHALLIGPCFSALN